MSFWPLRLRLSHKYDEDDCGQENDTKWCNVVDAGAAVRFRLVLQTDPDWWSAFTCFGEEFLTAVITAEIATTSVVFAAVDGVALKSWHVVASINIAGLRHDLLGDLHATLRVWLDNLQLL